MPQILRDQIWQFVGAAFGLLAIVVSIVLYWTQRRRKALSYDITSLTPLLEVEDEVKGKVQILFEGKLVQDVHLAMVKIINSGNMPIVPADYVRPVSLNFGEEAQILATDVIETNPDNLHVSWSVESTKVELVPLLLNGGDSITFKVLVSQSGEISVDGRIVGVKEITARRAQNTYQKLIRVLIIFGFGIMLVGALTVVLGAILGSPRDVASGALLVF